MAIPEAWTGVERPPLMHVGRHEGAGAFAFLAAVAAIDEGLADSALVLGSAADRGYAFFLTAPTPPAAPQRSGS
jgi:acetyl-CoA acetyltransferase